jgi:hypothetical protein
MTRLFERRWEVTIDTIKLTGLDVAFNVKKTLKPKPNTCELTLYNLNEEHIAQLENLRPKEKVATKGIGCRIEAVYVDGTSQIWLGDLRNCLVTKEGEDWVARLESGDGEKAWKNARLHVSFGPKTGLDTALRAMVRALGLGEGNLSKVVNKLKQNGTAIWPAGTVISGSAARELQAFAKSADLEVSIQDGALQFLDRGKALSSTAVRLAPETGLLGSPTVDKDGILEAKLLMVPDIRCGGLVTVDARRVKGAYRIEEAEWVGDTAGADWGITIRASRY